MYKHSNSSIFQKQNKVDISYNNHEGICYSGESFSKYGYQIVDLQKKMESFGGMDEVQEDIINQLIRSSQRLDTLTSKVRTFLKLQPNIKQKKSTTYTSYSPSSVQSHAKNTNKIHLSNVQKPEQKAMRLKDRVQKALEQQDSRTINIQKQPKYIK